MDQWTELEGSNRAPQPVGPLAKRLTSGGITRNIIAVRQLRLSGQSVDPLATLGEGDSFSLATWSFAGRRTEGGRGFHHSI